MAEKIFPRFESLSHCSSSMQKMSAIAVHRCSRCLPSLLCHVVEWMEAPFMATMMVSLNLTMVTLIVYGKGTLQLFALLGERF